MEILSKRIKDLRTDADLKQSELAAILGITQNMVSNYENGRDVPPEVLAGYAKKFNVSTDFLLGLSSVAVPANANVLDPFDDLFTVDPSSFSINDILALVRQFNYYYGSGAPAGKAPMLAFKGTLAAMNGILSSAAAHDIGGLLDQCNALGLCCLRSSDILKEYLGTPRGPSDGQTIYSA